MLVNIAISFFVNTIDINIRLVFFCKPDALAVQRPMYHTACRCLVGPGICRTLDVAVAVLNIRRFKAHSRMGSSNTPFQPVWGVWMSMAFHHALGAAIQNWVISTRPRFQIARWLYGNHFAGTSAGDRKLQTEYPKVLTPSPSP